MLSLPHLVDVCGDDPVGDHLLMVLEQVVVDDRVAAHLDNLESDEQDRIQLDGEVFVDRSFAAVLEVDLLQRQVEDFDACITYLTA